MAMADVIACIQIITLAPGEECEDLHLGMSV